MLEPSLEKWIEPRTSCPNSSASTALVLLPRLGPDQPPRPRDTARHFPGSTLRFRSRLVAWTSWTPSSTHQPPSWHPTAAQKPSATTSGIQTAPLDPEAVVAEAQFQHTINFHYHAAWHPGRPVHSQSFLSNLCDANLPIPCPRHTVLCGQVLDGFVPCAGDRTRRHKAVAHVFCEAAHKSSLDPQKRKPASSKPAQTPISTTLRVSTGPTCGYLLGRFGPASMFFAVTSAFAQLPETQAW